MARVQAPELQGDLRLRPAPIQSDTFQAPTRPSQDNRLASLADALSSFSGSIGRLGAVMGPTAEDKQNAEWAAQKKFSGRTRDEWKSAVESGEINNFQNPVESKAAMAIGGLEYGAGRGDEVRDTLQTSFDWDTQDPDTYITGIIQEDMKKYGDDKNFGANYLRQMEATRAWALDYATKRKSEQFNETKNRAAFGFIDTMVDQGVKTGTDPQQIADEVYHNYANLGTDGSLGVDFKQLDQELLNKARRIAGSSPDVAMALIMTERQGRDGEMRSLASNPDMQDTILQIQELAAKATDKQATARLLSDTADQDVEALKTGNLDKVGGFEYTTFDGDVRTVTAKERQDAATVTYLKQSEGIAKASREDGPAKLARELRAFRMSGVKHPQLEADLNGLSDMANMGMLENDPEAKQKMLGKLETYKWLRDASPNTLLAYTKEEDRQFAESYSIAKDYLKQDPDTALSTAIRATTLDKQGAAFSRAEQDSIDRGVGNLNANTFGWGDEPANYSVVEKRVSKLAGLLIRTGLKPDKAIEKAVQSVKETTITYNGVVLDPMGENLPDNFTQSVDEAIKDYSAKNPLSIERNGVEAGDISIAPAPSGGRFLLIDKTTMMPIHDDKGQQVFVTTRGLTRDAGVRAKDREKARGREYTFASSVKSRGLVKAKDTDGLDYWINPKTREVFEPHFGKNDLVPTWKKNGRRYKRGVVVTTDGGIVLKKPTVTDPKKKPAGPNKPKKSKLYR